VVTTFAAISRNPSRYSGNGAADIVVWYLGSDYSRLLELQDKLSARFASVAEAVNAAARKLLPLLLDLDGVLKAEGFDRAAWNASDLAERSRFNSAFLVDLSRALALLDGVKSPGRHLVVLDSERDALDFFNVAVANGLSAVWLGSLRLLVYGRNVAASVMTTFRRMLGEARAAVRRLRVNRELRKSKALDGDSIRAVDTWIVVWATEKTFTADCVLEREERAGRLPALLRNGGLRVGYIVLPLWPERYAEIVRAAAQCAEPVLTVEDGFTLRGLAGHIVGGLWPLLGIRRNLSWGGFDLSVVLQRAMRQERASARSMKVRQLEAIPRLLAALGASPASIVTTYENHSWEKVITDAAREYLPPTRIVGHNHALVSPLYVSVNPSPGDIAANVIPDFIMTLGALTGDEMAERGFPRERLVVAGGLRFEDFFERARSIPAPFASSVKTVLCCVGVDLDEALELVHKGAEAVAGGGFSLTVNFHPMSGGAFRNAVKDALRSRNVVGFDAIRFDDRPVRELLGETHAVLYIDSNAALEAAAAGRHIIYVKRETGIDYDKMPNGLAQHCRTPSEIRAALLSGRPLGDIEVDALLARCIAPVDASAILKVVRRSPAVAQ
jgi:hypothetical protein